MNYKAHFQGGPKHGDIDYISIAQQVYTVTTVYDVSGFRTKSKYNLVKQEDENLYYMLDEERFDGVDPTPFERNPR
jgi:hypothetical protein|tara:strand:+ start:144 stop:371 length:228 start_codon:yes stop_codon:yes gene_type:complete